MHCFYRFLEVGTEVDHFQSARDNSSEPFIRVTGIRRSYYSLPPFPFHVSLRCMAGCWILLLWAFFTSRWSKYPVWMLSLFRNGARHVICIGVCSLCVPQVRGWRVISDASWDLLKRHFCQPTPPDTLAYRNIRQVLARIWEDIHPFLYWKAWLINSKTWKTHAYRNDLSDVSLYIKYYPSYLDVLNIERYPLPANSSDISHYVSLQVSNSGFARSRERCRVCKSNGLVFF